MGMFGMPGTIPKEEREGQKKIARKYKKALEKTLREEEQKKRKKEEEMEKLLKSKSKNELIYILMDDYKKCPARLTQYFWWEAWKRNPPR